MIKREFKGSSSKKIIFIELVTYCFQEQRGIRSDGRFTRLFVETSLCTKQWEFWVLNMSTSHQIKLARGGYTYLCTIHFSRSFYTTPSVPSPSSPSSSLSSLSLIIIIIIITIVVVTFIVTNQPITSAYYHCTLIAANEPKVRRSSTNK